MKEISNNTLAMIGGGGALLGLVLGFGIGSSGPTAADPAPAPTVTVTAPAQVKSNPACLEALDDADDLIELGADALGVSAEVINMMPAALEAAVSWDAAGLEDATAGLKARSSEMEGLNSRAADLRDNYLDSSERCRS